MQVVHALAIAAIFGEALLCPGELWFELTHMQYRSSIITYA